MIERLSLLYPEIVLFLGACLVMVIGLSPKREVRSLCGFASAGSLLIAGLLAINTSAGNTTPLPGLLPYVKAILAGVGLLLVLLLSGVVDRRDEEEIAAGRRAFSAMRSNRAEFHAFFLFSLMGAMLCATADDLIWLFLALELTSLPTYVMVAVSTRGTRAQEAGVKYFFLGALGAGIFLYGFALLYGGTGSTNLAQIARELARQGAAGDINPIAMAGLMLAVVGVSFKIAAVPMHFYTPDVYQGAAAPVSAMLAFVPKTAGFVTILTLVSCAGWSYGFVDGRDVYGAGFALPAELRIALWVIAALTMTVGNVMAVLQTSIKRMLGYSSVAHSGYMLVGVLAGAAAGEESGYSFAQSGVAAVLFYLLVYGVGNLGAFAVLASMERRNPDGELVEADEFGDVRGLCRSSPLAGWTMVLSALSLLGLPPLLGFFGKFGLFSAGIAAGDYALVVILGLNSAIAAFYYLRLVAVSLLDEPQGSTYAPTTILARPLAGAVSALGVIVLIAFAEPLMQAATKAGRVAPMTLGVSPEGVRRAQTTELPEPGTGDRGAPSGAPAPEGEHDGAGH
ncbi:MAG: NADH-quinone oxidoreductase subunit N [Phycisphaerales bacterium]|nr:NADH-quinone oxidoreductase subunit N [Phycisphaerales bacterium]